MKNRISLSLTSPYVSVWKSQDFFLWCDNKSWSMMSKNSASKCYSKKFIKDHDSFQLPMCSLCFCPSSKPENGFLCRDLTQCARKEKVVKTLKNILRWFVLSQKIIDYLEPTDLIIYIFQAIFEILGQSKQHGTPYRWSKGLTIKVTIIGLAW